MPHRPHLQPLFDAARAWIEKSLGPGIPLQQITLGLGPGLPPVVLPVPPCPCTTPADPPADPDAALSEAEREVLQVFRESDEGSVLARDEIARRVGCEPGSRLAEALARLTRLGRLVNRRPGYALPG